MSAQPGHSGRGLVERLEAARAAGADARTLLALAEALLGDPAVVAQELPGAAARVADEYALLESDTRAAWMRFPVISGRGAHGGEPDPRALQLFSTLVYAREAGLYTPAELERADFPPEFQAREQLRLRVLVVLLGALIEELADGRLPAVRFAGEVTDIARHLGRLSIAMPPRG